MMKTSSKEQFLINALTIEYFSRHPVHNPAAGIHYSILNTLNFGVLP
jgi:hypothetical protein